MTCSQTKAQNISLPALFSDAPVSRRRRMKVPNPVTHTTAKVSDTGANTNKSQKLSVTPLVRPARRGRPRKVVEQCVVDGSDDIPTIIPRCRRVRHNVNTEAICDLRVTKVN